MGKYANAQIGPKIRPLKMNIEQQGQVLTKKIACLDSAFKGLDSLALVSAIKGQNLDRAIFLQALPAVL